MMNQPTPTIASFWFHAITIVQLTVVTFLGYYTAFFMRLNFHFISRIVLDVG